MNFSILLEFKYKKTYKFKGLKCLRETSPLNLETNLELDILVIIHFHFFKKTIRIRDVAQ